MLLRRIVFLICAIVSPNALAFDQTHGAWTQILKEFQTEDGLVAYSKLKSAATKDHPFPQYLNSVTSVKKSEFRAWTPQEQMAFLINSYNALTIKLIIDNYPVASIKKIGGLFKKAWSIEFFSLLEGDLKALDPIEHSFLRPTFKDFRIHAAVNCASYSCPPLRNEAFVGSKINEQLDDQMRKWLADPKRNQFPSSTDTVLISKIFDWYGDDFKNWGGGVKAVIEKFGPPEAIAAMKRNAKIDYLDYNWDLNESK